MKRKCWTAFSVFLHRYVGICVVAFGKKGGVCIVEADYEEVLFLVLCTENESGYMYMHVFKCLQCICIAYKTKHNQYMFKNEAQYEKCQTERSRPCNDIKHKVIASTVLNNFINSVFLKRFAS